VPAPALRPVPAAQPVPTAQRDEPGASTERSQRGRVYGPPVETSPSGGQPLAPGDPDRLGRYVLLRRLGVGPDSVVYAAKAPTGERVAIRLGARAESAARRLFASVASRPIPPFSSARVLEYGVHEGRPYLVNEHVDGVSVAQLLAEEGLLDAATVHGVAIGSMAALVGLHDCGQAHGGLDPTNVMVTLGGVRLVDQGLAQPAKGNQGRAEDLHGWARLVQYVAAGATGTAAPGTAVPPALRGVVAAAAAADAERGPTSRELLLMLSTIAPTARRAGPSPVRQRIGYAAAFAAAAAIVVLSFVSSSRPDSGAAQAAIPPVVQMPAPAPATGQPGADEPVSLPAPSPEPTSGLTPTAVNEPAARSPRLGEPRTGPGGAVVTTVPPGIPGAVGATTAPGSPAGGATLTPGVPLVVGVPLSTTLPGTPLSTAAPTTTVPAPAEPTPTVPPTAVPPTVGPTTAVPSPAAPAPDLPVSAPATLSAPVMVPVTAPSSTTAPAPTVTTPAAPSPAAPAPRTPTAPAVTTPAAPVPTPAAPVVTTAAPPSTPNVPASTLPVPVPTVAATVSELISTALGARLS